MRVHVWKTLTDPFHQIASGGFSYRLNPEQAALKALYECLQNRLGVLSLQDGAGVREVNARLGKKVLIEDRKSVV